jgi:hypothetical protein
MKNLLKSIRFAFVFMSLFVAVAGIAGISVSADEAQTAQPDAVQSLDPMYIGTPDIGTPNGRNPASAQFSGNRGVAGASEQLEKLQQFMNHPAVQFAQKLISNPALVKAIEQIGKSPERMNILYAEGVFFLIFLIFRIKRSLTPFAFGFIGALWFKLWTSIVYVAVSSVGIPWYFLGDSYMKLILELYQFCLSYLKS